MSQISKGIFGAAGVALVLGAVPLAFGHDLADRWQAVTGAPATSVNRAAKADRAAGVGPAASARTISLRLDSLADTSVLVRVPVAKDARNTPAAPAVTKSGNRKTAVACEPVVSVLTEVAKHLEPGRCVT
ncbi:MAG: hypothetical protein WAV72_17390 [Bradyrhizobium sp.]